MKPLVLKFPKRSPAWLEPEAADEAGTRVPLSELQPVCPIRHSLCALPKKFTTNTVTRFGHVSGGTTMLAGTDRKRGLRGPLTLCFTMPDVVRMAADVALRQAS